MIEPALTFALGAMLAALLALLMLPLVVRLAQRRATAAVERRLPVSAAEIAGDRDQMRAAHAVAVRALEQRIEALDARLAATLGEAGRQAGRLVASEESGARDRLALTTTEQALAEARGAAELAQAAAGAQSAALMDATALAERHGSALEAATARVTALEALLADQRVLIDEAAKRSGPGAMPSRDPSPAAPPTPASDDLVQVRAANIRLRNEQEVLLASVAAATRERDRLRLHTDELLLRIDALQQAAAEASDTTDADDRLAARHARTIATLRKRLAARDESIATLTRRLADTPPSTTREPEPLPLFAALPGAGDPRDAAALRQAVAQLAADIVRFATPSPRSLPPLG